jgi:hypothetical protein
LQVPDLRLLLKQRIGPNGPKTLPLQLKLAKLSSNQIIANLLNIVSTQKLDDATLKDIQGRVDQLGLAGLPSKPQQSVPASVPVQMPMQMPVKMQQPNPRTMANVPMYPMQPMMPPISSANIGALLTTTPTAVYRLDQDTLSKKYQLLHTLYSSLEFACKQCGLRFTRSHLMDRHLDWHFRQSKRKSDLKRTISRAWYLSIDEWLVENTDEINDTSSKSECTAYRCSNSNAIAVYMQITLIQPFQRHSSSRCSQWKIARNQQLFQRENQQ